MDYTLPATALIMALRLYTYTKKGHDEENLTVATHMNYTRLFHQWFKTQPYGLQTVAPLVAKCNSYTPQH